MSNEPSAAEACLATLPMLVEFRVSQFRRVLVAAIYRCEETMARQDQVGAGIDSSQMGSPGCGAIEELQREMIAAAP